MNPTQRANHIKSFVSSTLVEYVKWIEKQMVRI